jgi:WD40 repeat protein
MPSVVPSALRAILTIALAGGCSPSVQALEAPADPQSKVVASHVTARDYSARLDLLSLGYDDGTFEVRTPAPHHVFSRGKHDSRIADVALSNDGTRLASIDAGGVVAISVVETGELTLVTNVGAELGHGARRGLSWDGSGNRLAIGSGRTLRLLDLRSGDSQQVEL